MKKKQKKIKLIKRIVIFLLLAGITAVGTIGYTLYNYVYAPNVVKSDYLFIPTNSELDSVTTILVNNNFIKNKKSFDWVAEEKNYRNHINPGRYALKAEMSNEELVNLLRSGKQESISLIINNIRLLPELTSLIGKSLETDSTFLLGELSDYRVAQKYGFNKESFRTMFIPNTYQFNWNTDANEFISRMAKEYKLFWNKSRKAKAKKLDLSQTEVSILASIVQKESQKKDEKPTIAGVYYNRLRKGMLLQADPTLIYAANDFGIHRVLNKHKKIDSPYNTYINKGLPPGPICFAEITSLEAVLNLKKHNYIYFCAKEDFSGYHNFAKNYTQHLINARKFQRAMNKRKIYK